MLPSTPSQSPIRVHDKENLPVNKMLLIPSVRSEEDFSELGKSFDDFTNMSLASTDFEDDAKRTQASGAALHAVFLQELQALRKESLDQVESIHELETKCCGLELLVEDLKHENEKLTGELKASMESLLESNDEVMTLQKKVSSLETSAKRNQTESETIALMSDTIRLLEAKILNITHSHQEELERLRREYESKMEQQEQRHDIVLQQELSKQEHELQMRSFNQLALYLKSEILEQNIQEGAEWVNDIPVNGLYEEARESGVHFSSWLAWIRTKCQTAMQKFRSARARKSSPAAASSSSS